LGEKGTKHQPVVLDKKKYLLPTLRKQVHSASDYYPVQMSQMDRQVHHPPIQIGFGTKTSADFKQRGVEADRDNSTQASTLFDFQKKKPIGKKTFTPAPQAKNTKERVVGVSEPYTRMTGLDQAKERKHFPESYGARSD
jgi:hypothetical protein